LTVEPDFKTGTLEEAVNLVERNMNSTTPARPEPIVASAPPVTEPVTNTAPETEGTPVAEKKMTFAERVRAGTYQPARSETAGPAAAAPDRPRRAIPAAGETTSISAIAPSLKTTPPPSPEPIAAVKQTEALGEAELLEPLLQQLLEETRLIRQQSHQGHEFSVTKLLAGIVQVLVLPALFFAYLHRDTPTDLQSLLLLATFLQTLTISLLIMGRQTS
jgi:hypothetical protein